MLGESDEQVSWARNVQFRTRVGHGNVQKLLPEILYVSVEHEWINTPICQIVLMTLSEEKKWDVGYLDIHYSDSYHEGLLTNSKCRDVSLI